MYDPSMDALAAAPPAAATTAAAAAAYFVVRNNTLKLKQRARREHQQLKAAVSAVAAVAAQVERNAAVAAAAASLSASPIKAPKVLHHRQLAKEKSHTSNEWAPMVASKHAQNTVNPIRKICDSLAVPPNEFKTPIRLNLGDPTITGNLPPSKATIDAIHKVIDEHKHDGYGPAVGIESARQAIVRHFSKPAAPFSADDVVLASGCSHAIQLAIEAIADAGDNILVPCPGFPLYGTLCTPHNIEAREYSLRMDDDGLVDLDHLEEQIDSRTKAIIVNNPSNPTGVVFPKEHLEAILRVAEKHKVVIIADEIYGDIIYDGAIFHAMSSLTPRVPIITCDGIAKRYLVPGWRLGWLIVHDRFGALTNIRRGIIALSQKIVGPCALVQGALPAILDNTRNEYFEQTRRVISANSAIVYEMLRHVPGLRPLRPQGAMYMMVGVDEDIYGAETPFLQKLIREESVYCLPGSAFNLPNWFRLVLTYPEEVTREACQRIVDYCQRHMAPLNAVSYSRQTSRRAIDEGSEGSLSNAEESDEC